MGRVLGIHLLANGAGSHKAETGDGDKGVDPHCRGQHATVQHMQPLIKRVAWAAIGPEHSALPVDHAAVRAVSHWAAAQRMHSQTQGFVHACGHPFKVIGQRFPQRAGQVVAPLEAAPVAGFVQPVVNRLVIGGAGAAVRARPADVQRIAPGGTAGCGLARCEADGAIGIVRPHDQHQQGMPVHVWRGGQGIAGHTGSLAAGVVALQATAAVAVGQRQGGSERHHGPRQGGGHRAFFHQHTPLLARHRQAGREPACDGGAHALGGWLLGFVGTGHAVDTRTHAPAQGQHIAVGRKPLAQQG